MLFLQTLQATLNRTNMSHQRKAFAAARKQNRLLPVYKQTGVKYAAVIRVVIRQQTK